MQTRCASCDMPIRADAPACSYCGAPTAVPGAGPAPRWTLGAHARFGDDAKRSGPAVLVGRIVGIAAAMAVVLFVAGPLLEPFGVFGAVIAVVAFGIAGRLLGEWAARLLMRLLGHPRPPVGGG